MTPITQEALAAALRLVPGTLTWIAPDGVTKPGDKDQAAVLAQFIMARLLPALPAYEFDDGACPCCGSLLNSGDGHNDGCPHLLDVERLARLIAVDLTARFESKAYLTYHAGLANMAADCAEAVAAAYDADKGAGTGV